MSEQNFRLNGLDVGPGGIVPLTDATTDLGSPSKQWRHVYVSTGSIYLGNVKH